MTNIKKVCKLCSTAIIVNGAKKAHMLMEKHILEQHPEQYKEHELQSKEFDKELAELHKKLPNINVDSFFSDGD